MKFEQYFSTLPVRYRWPIVVASALLVVLAALGTNNLYFENTYKQWFAPDNPDLLVYEDLELTFSKNENILILIEPPGGDSLTKENLELVLRLTEESWQVPYTSRVDSITNFQHTVAVEDDLLVGDLVPDTAVLDAAEIARIREVALSEPNLVNRLISTSGHVTAVNVTLLIPDEYVGTGPDEAVKYLRQMLSGIEPDYPDTRFYLAGVVMMNQAFVESSIEDSTTLIPASFLLMFLILALMVGRVSGTVATMLLTVASILAALGIWGHMGQPLSTATSVAPIIILTVAIANCVHVVATFRHGINSGLDKSDAIRESVRVNLQPVALASLTTAVGFLALNFSDAPPFADLGNVVALGVLASLLLSLTFLPATLSLLPARASRRLRKSGRAMERIAEFVIARYRVLIRVIPLIVICLSLGLTQIVIDDVFVNYFDHTVRFRVDSDFAAENLGGTTQVDYALQSGESGGVANPAYLRDIAALSEWLEAQPEVIHVNTLSDTMRRLNKSMHGDAESAYVLPDNRELAAQYLLMYELSLPYGLDMTNQVDIEKSSTRMTVTLKNISSQEILDLDLRAQRWVSENLENVEPIAGTGPQMIIGKLGIRNVKSMMLGLAVAIVLISVVLVIAFRSPFYGLISLIPNLAPILMAFGIWGLHNGVVGLGLAGVSSIGLGIVIDDTVHFMSKYLRGIREHGYSAPNAVRHAFRTVGHALWTTSVILTIGFFVISRSHFYLNYGIGFLTATVIVLAVACVFFFLPPILLALAAKPGKAHARQSA